MKKRVFFGGAFDPFHIGHLVLIESCYHFYKTNCEIFVSPTYAPPHKKKAYLGVYSRISSLEALNNSLNYTRLYLGEFNTQDTSYTWESLKRLERMDLKMDALLIGQDQLIAFESWFDYRKILAHLNLVVGIRDVNQNQVKAVAERLRDFGCINMLDHSKVLISSSKLKTFAKQSWRSWLPKVVFDRLDTLQVIENES